MNESPFLRDFENNFDGIYFDNSATTQKLKSVVTAIVGYYSNGVAAYGRGEGPLNVRTRELFDNSKQTIADFFGVKRRQVIITKSATEASNLAFFNYRKILKEEDKVWISAYEHNSVYFPAKRLQQEIGVELERIAIAGDGRLNLEWVRQNISDPKLRLVCAGSVSNVLGIENDLDEFSRILSDENRKRDMDNHIYSHVDNVGNMLGERMNFSQYDFGSMMVASHKMYGPSVGCLLVAEELLDSGWFGPEIVGGGIAKWESFGFEDSIDFPLDDLITKDKEGQFMAGVPDTAGVIGMATACEYLRENEEEHYRYLDDLCEYLIDKLRGLDQIEILGGVERKRHNVVSFLTKDRDSARLEKIARILSENGVDTRWGRHCADVLYEFLDVEYALRLSLAAYNTRQEVDRVVEIIGAALA